MFFWVATSIALALAACKPLTDFDECQCGNSETPSKLKCSSRGFCEGQFEVVGHSDLGARGMNSAIALAGNYVYVGSRTDGQTHENAGVLIVDVTDPAAPAVVGEIGAPDEGVLGLSARELRAVPDLNLLFVLNIACSTVLHACSRNLNMFPRTGGVTETDNLKIYDLTDPVNPRLLSRYDFFNQPDSPSPAPPHEFFLWRDPVNPTRIILYVTRLVGPPSIEVIDVSDPSAPYTITKWDGIIDAGLDVARGQDDGAHSISVSDDGRTLYLAYFGAGFFMLDSSTIADAAPAPRIDLLTPLAARVDYSPPYYPGTHSALKVPGRDLVVLTDEIYPIDLDQGCPWGWGWMVDITDPRAPTLFERTDHATGVVTVLGQMRLAQNDKANCPTDAVQRRVAYTAHNPTVTENLVILTWYSGGLQAFDISDPVNPKQVGAFFPDGLPAVELEDPVLSGATTLMWSYPIFRDGLIYVVDIRNGLYTLRYNGPFAEEVSSRTFLEGSSNLR